MFRLIANIICGYFILTVPKELRGAVYDIMLRLKIEFFGERNDKSGTLYLKIPRKNLIAFKAEAERCGIEGLNISVLKGFPVALRFLRRRLGITVGAVLLIIWSMVSQRIVWDVKIDGNDSVPDSEITALLEELGCGIGDWIPNIDFDDVHAKYMALSDNISWISVYMNGVVAEVQVREMIRDTRVKPEPDTYANVVAGEDGEIDMVNVFEGQAAVHHKDIVRAGDVLISGVMEAKEDKLRYEYAAGEVWAKTVRRIDVEIACEREEKVYTGRETVKKSVKFFKNVVNLFRNTGIDYIKYDKISKTERVSLWGICELPIWISETVYREYDYELCEVSAETAAAEGLAELRRLTDEATENAEILEKNISTEFTGGKYIIQCVLYCLRDIGRTEEFVVTD